MKIRDRHIKKLFDEVRQYQIPLFQRYYTWREKHWKQLWDDIVEMLKAKKSHFMGVLVTALPPTDDAPESRIRHVVDGQQRLTTLSLLFCAMKDIAKDNSFVGDFHKKIKDEFLVHPDGEHAGEYKILLSYRNRGEYQSVVKGEDGEDAGGIRDAYGFFVKNISKYIGSGEDAVDKFKFLKDFVETKLVFGLVALGEDDNANKIFKSLNATGKSLSESDLIRNHVFWSISPDRQERFDRQEWAPLENKFRSAEGAFDRNEFTSFLRHSIQRKDGYVPPKAVSEKFEEKYGNPCTPEEIVKELSRLTGNYLCFVRDDTPFSASDIEAAIKMVRDLSVSQMVAPLILRLLELNSAGAIEKDVLIDSVKNIAGFVFRRYVCGESSRGYAKWFCALSAKLDEGTCALSTICDFLVEKGWPKDGKFKDAFVVGEMGKGKYARVALETLEKNEQQPTEPVGLRQCDIEHVMPQTLTDNWKLDLGGERKWNAVHEKWLHTPGNLTLVGRTYNRGVLQNRPYKEKQKCLVEESKVSLNSYFKGVSAWTEAEIEDRGKKLADAAAKIWPGPPLE